MCERAIAADLEVVKGCMPEHAKPLDWHSEHCVEAHCVVNTLQNALYHRRSGRTGRQGERRRALLPKMTCNSFASARVVSFDLVTIDIASSGFMRRRTSDDDKGLLSDEKGLLSVHTRVPTGLLSPAASHKAATAATADILERASSSTSSARSLDSTVPRDELDHACDHDAAAHGKAVPVIEACLSCGDIVSHTDICDILTTGSDTRCSPVDICDVLTTGGLDPPPHNLTAVN